MCHSGHGFVDIQSLQEVRTTPVRGTDSVSILRAEQLSNTECLKYSDTQRGLQFNSKQYDKDILFMLPSDFLKSLF